MTSTVTDPVLSRARAGDEHAFRMLTDPHRRELQVHLYRIVGSAHDAEDLLQETLLAAWRGLDGFEGRATLRGWLYRIATNHALDAVRACRRRPSGYEPFPDALLADVADDAPGPEARYETREAVSLAFVAGLAHLPAQQRAVLVLRDVLGFRAAEAAGMLDMTETSVHSLLVRARRAFAARLPTTGRERAPLPGSPAERAVVTRFADAVEAGDIDAVIALLVDDAWLTMPPEPSAFQGPAAIGAFMREREDRRSAPLRLIATRANGQPAFGCYLAPSPSAPVAHAFSIFVLTVAGDRVSAITWFGGDACFPLFGLPAELVRDADGPGRSGA